MRIFFVVMILICLCLSGCQKDITPPVLGLGTPLSSEPTSSPITPSISYSITPTYPASVSTSTTTPQPSPSLTETVQTTPIVNIVQQCIDISDYTIPEEKNLQGIIPMMPAPQYTDSYLFNLTTGEKINFLDDQTTYTRYGTVSPSGEWMAYIGYKDILAKDDSLVIVNSLGEQQVNIPLSSIVTEDTKIQLNEWLDQESLIFQKIGYDFEGGPINPSKGIILVFDPFTGEQRQLQSDYPEIYTIPPDYYYRWERYNFTLSIYNPALDRVLYMTRYGVVLWDVMNQQQIKFMDDDLFRNFTHPVWAPDGERFVIDLDTPSSRNLFIFSEDGEGRQVTFLPELPGGDYPGIFSQFTWSPDGESIAFWLFKGRDTETQNYIYELAVLNLSTHEVQNLCVPGYVDHSSVPKFPPFWAPDGSGLVIATRAEKNPQRSEAILVDLINNRAFRLANDVIPVGWMNAE